MSQPDSMCYIVLATPNICVIRSFFIELFVSALRSYNYLQNSFFITIAGRSEHGPLSDNNGLIKNEMIIHDHLAIIEVSKLR